MVCAQADEFTGSSSPMERVPISAQIIFCAWAKYPGSQTQSSLFVAPAALVVESSTVGGAPQDKQIVFPSPSLYFPTSHVVHAGSPRLLYFPANEREGSVVLTKVSNCRATLTHLLRNPCSRSGLPCSAFRPCSQRRQRCRQNLSTIRSDTSRTQARQLRSTFRACSQSTIRRRLRY